MNSSDVSIFELTSNYSDSPEKLIELAAENYEQKKFYRAKFILYTLIKKFPPLAEYYSELGTVCKRLMEYDQAEKYYYKAIDLNPDFYVAFYNLGLLYCEQEKTLPEIECYKKVIALKPDLFQAYYNLGNAYRKLEDYNSAINFYKSAIQIKADYGDAYYNLGVVYEKSGNYSDALESYDNAVIYSSNKDSAYWNRTLLKLKLGNFEEGWTEYECRKDLKSVNTKKITEKLLTNQDVKGKKILVYSEQGLGDIIQFFRYLKLLKDRGGFVIFECNSKLLPLFYGHYYYDKLIPQTGSNLSPDEYDYQTALMSLPKYFMTRLNSIPNMTPYIFPDAEKVPLWKEKIGNRKKLKVGIAWQGASNNPNGKSRSCSLKDLEKLFLIEGVEYFSLQKDADFGRDGKPKSLNIFNDFDTEPFIDSAAIICNMDIVITIDTSVAHLSGALGKETWIMLPFDADWRWFINTNESPWYPTVKLFRQPMENKWEPVVDEIVKKLKEFVNNQFNVLNNKVNDVLLKY